MNNDHVVPATSLPSLTSLTPDTQSHPSSVVHAPFAKALLMGYYGMGNLGDEMMLFCLKPWLKERGFDVTVLSERPEAVSKQHALPAVENSTLLGEWAWRTSWLKGGAWRVIRAILRSDSLILGGGELIRDDLGWRTFFYTMEKLIVALMLGKKVYVVNVGIGQPSTGYGRLVLRWVLARCHGIIVRDLQSEQICKQLGVSSAVLAPDIVLSLPEILGKRPGASVNELPAEPCVTVCLRHNPNVFGRYSMNEPQIRTLARALDDLVEKRGVNVVFIPFQENPASGEGDSQLHQVVAQGMVHKDRVFVRPWTADFDEVCRWIRGARFVVSMRLHAAVLAQAYGRPSVLMPCDRKIREFGRLMNIRHVIEAISLDEVAKVSSVLASAWLEAQEKKGVSRQSAASLWAGLRLDSA